MGKGKNKGQSLNRKLKRGVIDQFGNSLKRPFNNSKRNEGSFQLEREKFYFGMKDYLQHLSKLNNNEVINNIEVKDVLREQYLNEQENNIKESK